METLSLIKDFLIHTPAYVYVIFIYLIYIGIKAVKGRTIPVSKLFIVPIIFLILSIVDLFAIGTMEGYFLSWLVGIIIGALFGWWQYSRLNIKVDKQKRLLTIQGSWVTLWLIILTFVVKYYIGFTIATDHNLSPQFAMALAFLSGLFTGVFIGRLVYGLYQLKYGTHVDIAVPREE